MVILDSNLWIRACAFEPDEIDPFRRTPSKHDELSSPEHGLPQLKPSHCRHIITSHLQKEQGLFIPAQQVTEIDQVLWKMKDARLVGPENLRLMKAVGDFVRKAGESNRVFISPKNLEEQHAVIAEALSIAHSTGAAHNAVERLQAKRFIAKNEHHLARTLPKPNIEAVARMEKPYICTDWLLARAAHKINGVVVTADRDMIFLNSAYEKVCGYRPCRHVEHAPMGVGPDEFELALIEPKSLQSAHHLKRLPLPPPPRRHTQTFHRSHGDR